MTFTLADLRRRRGAAMVRFVIGLVAGVAVIVLGLLALQYVEAALPSAFRSIAVDGAGNLLLVEPPDTAFIRFAATDGYAAGETIGRGVFKHPLCAGVDGNSNLFVADQDGNAIREALAVDGYKTVKTLTAGVATIASPCSLAIDSAGDIFDFEFQSVKEFLAEGGYASVRTLAVGQLGRNGVLDAGDNVFFLDRGAVKELETASGYAEEKVIANGAYKLNGSLAIDAQGDLFLATDDAVEEIRAEDGYARITTLTKGRYYFPHGMAADRAGNLFVADFPGRQVQQLLATGGYRQVKPIAVAAIRSPSQRNFRAQSRDQKPRRTVRPWARLATTRRGARNGLTFTGLIYQPLN